MITDYYYRVAEFLQDFLRLPRGETIPPDPFLIRIIITAILLPRHVNQELLRRLAISTHNLIIREDLFPREDKR